MLNGAKDWLIEFAVGFGMSKEYQDLLADLHDLVPHGLQIHPVASVTEDGVFHARRYSIQRLDQVECRGVSGAQRSADCNPLTGVVSSRDHRIDEDEGKNPNVNDDMLTAPSDTSSGQAYLHGAISGGEDLRTWLSI